MDYTSHPEYRGHERVVFANDSESGLRAIIAIHSTVLGPAAGGCRVWSYESELDALTDALRLSRGMTFKNSIAGLDLGGGKAVIMLRKGQEKTEAMMFAFGRAVEDLKGQYYTAEDVGVTTADMMAVHTQTDFVAGLPKGKFASGDPSPVTARGVFEGIKIVCTQVLDVPELDGVRIAVQGVGNVGWHLCEMLHESGAQLIVSDVNAARCQAAAERFDAQIGDLSQFHAVDCDVYAPCALGGTLNRASVHEIRARIVAGAANNQLEREEDAKVLHDAGIVYMPDFLINAGGILNAASEIKQIADATWVGRRLDALVSRMSEVLTVAQSRNLAPHYVAMEMAENRIRDGRLKAI